MEDDNVLQSSTTNRFIWHTQSEEKILTKNRCGIACWRPRCLEPLRDIRAFIAATCFISCLQAAFSGYNSSQITTIEKRFSVGSIIIGIINASFEIGYISFVMIVSYGGSKGRVPYWIACGLFSMGIGSILYSTPQFLFTQTPVSLIHYDEKLCQINSNIEHLNTSKTCEIDTTNGYSFLPVLLVAQFLIGAGSSPILTLAPPFIDDHVPTKKAPAMIASIYAAAALGPVFGYALGAVLLQVPVDFLSAIKILPPSIKPSSPHWIGAWWTGYLILGSGIIFGAFMLLLFPRHLRSTTPDGLRKTLSRRQDILHDLDEPTATSESHNVNNNDNNNAPIQPNAINSDNMVSRSYHEINVCSRRGNSVLGPLSIDPRHHQRTASGGSVFINAAIAAATASVIIDAWPSTEDDEDDDEVDEDENYASQLYHSCEAPPGSLQLCSPNQLDPKSKPYNQAARTIISRSRHKSVPNRQYTRQYRSAFMRTPLHFSVNLRRHSVEQRKHERQRWTSSSNIDSSEVSRSTNATPFFEAHSQSPSPTLLTMLNLPEESNSEGTPTLVKRTFASDSSNTKLESCGAGDGFSIPVVDEPLAEELFKSNSNYHGQKTITGGDAEVPPTQTKFQRLRRHRRRTQKMFRGRIFGFITVWSKDIPHSISQLLLNKVYIVTCMCICCELFVVIGFAGFLPKYLETEYQISKAKASMIAGGLIVPSGAFGILVGGLILNKSQIGRRAAIILVLCVNIAIIACLGTFFFLGCNTPAVAGFNAPYPFSQHVASSLVGDVYSVESTSALNCAASCGCDQEKYSPVCHRKSRTMFISPCFAGCAKGPEIVEAGKTKVYWNCTCLSNFLAPGEMSRSSTAYIPTDLVYTDEVVAGGCDFVCSTLTPFICFLTVCLFLTGVIQNPLLMVTMRSVGRSERSLALGLQFVIVRLLANLPSPIAFGRAIDEACLKWHFDCGRRGDCAIMDLKALTLYITLLAIAIKIFSVLIYTVLIYLIPPNSPGKTNDLTRGSTIQSGESNLNGDQLRQLRGSLSSAKHPHQTDINNLSQTSTLKSIQDALSNERT